MRIRVEHRTMYAYAAPLARGVQLARLFPSAHEGAIVTAWRVTAQGGKVGAPFLDGHANRCALVTLNAGVRNAEIRVAGQVETRDTAGRYRGAEPLAPAYFLRETPLTQPDESIRTLTVPDEAWTDAAIALMHLVRDRVDYRTGATDVHVPAAEALARGAGVCQDHAHILIAALRLRGIPARYVSGYLFAGDSHAASHAWVEAFMGYDWLGLDPSNRHIVDEAYVRLACGLDYASARPLSGVRVGGAEETLSVAVEVQAQQ